MTPILYSFRRCPYAIRARLALVSAQRAVELREVVLRDKPEAFLAASPSATVPCLVTSTSILDESLDIMIWALRQNDPDRWLEMPDEGHELIAWNDGPFKDALDRTKYAARFPDCDPEDQRRAASAFLADLDARIDDWIFGRPSLADFAILPFVRQFAFIDKPRFDAEPWTALQGWLDRFLASDLFGQTMTKHTQWSDGDNPKLFPDIMPEELVP